MTLYLALTLEGFQFRFADGFVESYRSLGGPDDRNAELARCRRSPAVAMARPINRTAPGRNPASRNASPSPSRRSTRVALGPSCTPAPTSPNWCACSNTCTWSPSCVRQAAAVRTCSHLLKVEGLLFLAERQETDILL